MRRIRSPFFALFLLAAGCAGPPGATSVYAPHPGSKEVVPLATPLRLYLGRRDSHWSDFAFDGGELEFELYRFSVRVAQIARNRYAAPVVIRWTMIEHENLESPRPLEGIAILPAAAPPLGAGPEVLLAQLHQIDRSLGYQVRLKFTINFGDPWAKPSPYVYGLPYPAGSAFRVIQGFHGKQTHAGVNEYAVDFNCPEGTPVLAMRPGQVLVTQSRALTGGTTSYHKDWKQGNFVLVIHDDGTIARYLHLAPESVSVRAGQRVERGERIALSGNTGFSQGPHLHVDISTSGGDGASIRTFPFRFAIASHRDEEPVEGAKYSAWERHP